MQLITRGDVDGLACAVFLSIVENVESIRFAHPKDMQDGLYPVTADDIIANLPWHPNCGLWFDHHASSLALVPDPGSVPGLAREAPSAARLVYEYYHDDRLKLYDDFLHQVDRFDSADLDMEDVTSPRGWILLAYTIDPRSGLGRFREYFIDMVEWVRTMTLDEILAIPEVRRRCDEVASRQAALLQSLRTHARLDGPVIVTDFRALAERPVGNRFLVYTLFPEGTVEVRLFYGKSRETVVVAVGKSIFNRSCPVDVGALLAEYGGGGHLGAGTCQLEGPDVEARVAEIIARLGGGGTS